ncbi:MULTISPECIES: RNA polymerase sigma factor region1.1 domain-containing protein [Stigmatella]|uniref:Sigma-70 factor, region 1.1 n=2 Tax=Stigmatella TaxID=40 RepID=A0A1H7N5G3_STIAU|nr:MULTISPECIES: RNA polymerase sigma factor region1.1 domain-containing protein [Stigmatella]SEL18549.1 Sigma-70 factor, region 1.1 [Stigmatella aurantiaca]SES73422.1 Sigma-70 factor, region 1.1 [Stigmatella erecta]
MENRIGKSYMARKALFAKGLRDGRLTVQEIEEALPSGTLTAAERWLLYYSLRAAQVEIIDEVTGQVDHGFLQEHESAPSEH